MELQLSCSTCKAQACHQTSQTCSSSALCSRKKLLLRQTSHCTRFNTTRKGACRKGPSHDRPRHVSRRAASASAASSSAGEKRTGVDGKLIASVGLVLVLGVLNRVFNKLATVPMSNYLFFLAQIQTFGYVFFYGAVLYIRTRSGKVPPEMHNAVQKKKFAAIGGLEAAAQVISMLCVSKLPGVVLPLLNQTILLWQAALGYVFLGQRFSKLQLAGILLVVGGVAKAAWPSGTGGSVLGQTSPLYVVLFSFAFLILAAVSLVKDSIFKEGKRNLNGQNLDLFIVNTYGSFAQAGFVFLLLPVLSTLKNIPLRQLPSYLLDGSKALLGRMPGTEGAPLLPLSYIAINLAFNISVLNLLRTSGALITTLSLSALIPLTIVAFTFEWPLIGAAASLGPNFVIGTALLLSGLVAYNWESLTKQKEA